MRKSEWFLTYNKIENVELESISEIKKKLEKYQFFGILHDKETTPHYHIYIYNRNGIAFETLQNMFKGIHIEQVKSTRKDIYNYMQHLDTDKNEYSEFEIFTNVENIIDFIDNSKLSMDEDIVQLAIRGKNVKQILMKYPCNWRSIDKLIKLVEICQLDTATENTKKGQVNDLTF